MAKPSAASSATTSPASSQEARRLLAICSYMPVGGRVAACLPQVDGRDGLVGLRDLEELPRGEVEHAGDEVATGTIWILLL